MEWNENLCVIPVIPDIYDGEIEVAIVWVWNQSFGDRTAAIFRVELRDQGDEYTALLPTQKSSSSVIRGFNGGEI